MPHSPTPIHTNTTTPRSTETTSMGAFVTKTTWFVAMGDHHKSNHGRDNPDDGTTWIPTPIRRIVGDDRSCLITPLASFYFHAKPPKFWPLHVLWWKRTEWRMWSSLKRQTLPQLWSCIGSAKVTRSRIEKLQALANFLTEGDTYKHVLQTTVYKIIMDE